MSTATKVYDHPVDRLEIRLGKHASFVTTRRLHASRDRAGGNAFPSLLGKLVQPPSRQFAASLLLARSPPLGASVLKSHQRAPRRLTLTLIRAIVNVCIADVDCERCKEAITTHPRHDATADPYIVECEWRSSNMPLKRTAPLCIPRHVSSFLSLVRSSRRRLQLRPSCFLEIDDNGDSTYTTERRCQWQSRELIHVSLTPRSRSHNAVLKLMAAFTETCYAT